jgi:hypothetical protein
MSHDCGMRAVVAGHMPHAVHMRSTYITVHMGMGINNGAYM